MKIFARFELSRGRLLADNRALLLEGDWPSGQRSEIRQSLDAEIDGRYGWIDEQAAELAERFAHSDYLLPGQVDSTDLAARFAWLHAVKLRYLLVKLLRVVAFLSQHPGGRLSPCELFFEPGRDDGYRHLLMAMARRGDFELREHKIGSGKKRSLLHRPGNSAWRWRRAAGRLAGFLQPAVAANRRRVVLCGQPRLLAPVCRELVQRGVQPWWLGQRFAPRGWLRWRTVGGGLLACDGGVRSKLGRQADDFVPFPSDAAEHEDELLAPAVMAWLAALAREQLPAQGAESEAIGRHLDRVRPHAVVLDQDGSPFHRAVVAAARERGVPTTVVQHGAPMVRFGFAPLVADRFCAWGQTSADQLLRWGVGREQIRVTGTAMPLPAEHAVQPVHALPPRFVLLATLAPSDSRPDLVNYHLTSGTYASMLRWTLASLADWPGSQVLIKLHPRDPRSQALRQVVAQLERPAIKIVASGSLASVLGGADCVLSCASSAGIEAAARGWPVIQLMPEGSRNLIESRAWGLIGTARCKIELSALVAQVLTGHWKATNVEAGSIIAASGRVAAVRIADVLLEPPGGLPVDTSVEFARVPYPRCVGLRAGAQP